MTVMNKEKERKKEKHFITKSIHTKLDYGEEENIREPTKTTQDAQRRKKKKKNSEQQIYMNKSTHQPQKQSKPI